MVIQHNLAAMGSNRFLGKKTCKAIVSVPVVLLKTEEKSIRESVRSAGRQCRLSRAPSVVNVRNVTKRNFLQIK